MAMIAAAVLAAFFQLTAAQRVAWVPNPRIGSGGWIADPSHHLAPATITQVNDIAGALERETGSEIGVAIVDSTSGLELQEFATALHRAWGIGTRGKNNGVLLLWDPVHRGIFISVGYGLEGAIPDRRAGRIRDDITTRLRAGNFDEGVLTGVRELADAAREEPAGPARPQRVRGSGPPFFLIPLLFFPLVLIAGIGGTLGWLRWRRHRPRECSKGHPMRLLTKEEELSRLDQGERLEEQLKSVDWDVWVCDHCGEVQRIAHRVWFSKYLSCPQCQRRTMVEDVKVMVAATIASGGREHVDQRCGNCQFTRSFERETPRVTKPGDSGSSGWSAGGGSSDGGGGSFGGGSAGGGGAGGHY